MNDAAGTPPPPAPLWRQILLALRARIEAGDYPLGSRLPTESAICAEFGASRHTVREALRALVQLGMIARRQGSGSVVTAPAGRAAYTQTIQSLSELFLFAMETHFEVRAMRMVVPVRAARIAIGAVEGEAWLLVKGLRSDAPGGNPICWTHSYIHPRLSWVEPELPGCTGAFYAHLEQRSGEAIIEASQEISGELMNREVATALDRTAGDVTLRVLRRYFSNQGIMIASFNWHPADSFTYRMQLKRAG